MGKSEDKWGQWDHEMKSPEWEHVIHGTGGVERLPVEGGWVYKVKQVNGYEHTFAVCFVPSTQPPEV